MHGIAKLLSVGLVFATVLSAAPGHAAQKEKKKGGENNAAFNIPSEITLTDAQKAKLDELKKEQGPKLAELNAKLDALMSPDQKAARKEAAAKAKADGKKGKEAQAAVEEALKLTEEQKKQRDEIQPEIAKLQRSVKEQIHGFLTDEQKTHYKLPKAKKVK